MGKKLRKTAVFAPLVFAIISCVTINIYFPAAAVEKAADQIVEEVWGGQEQENNKEKEKNGKQQGLLKSWTRLASLTIGPSVAHAQEADINVTTPGIRAIKDSISQRADSIKPFLDRGNVGIANDGLLVIRTTDGLDLKEKATLTRLIKSENDDREALYAEIAKANNFSPDRIPDIKKLFAGSWIKMARKGWWVQSDDGRWSQKE
ncbi:MAG TPA: YdbL family protein [Thermodesulfobacteriota bacterium]|nr:YdbL family protein [Thermodesulfobacteriota bacterium]